MATSWLLFKSLLTGAFCRKVIKSIPPRLPDIVYIYCFLSLSLSVSLSIYCFLSSRSEAADPDVDGGRKKKWNAAATTARWCNASIFIPQTFK